MHLTDLCERHPARKQRSAESGDWRLSVRPALGLAFAAWMFAHFAAIPSLVPLLHAVGQWHEHAEKPFYAWIGEGGVR